MPVKFQIMIWLHFLLMKEWLLIPNVRHGTFKGLLNLARDRVTYAFNCIHDDLIHWPDPDERKKLLVKLKENTFCQIVCQLWIEPFSNWHLNWSVQIKQIITAANMLVALLEMFCMTTNARSEITWQVFQDQCTIAVCGRIWTSNRTQRHTFPQMSMFSLILHINPTSSYSSL